MFISLIWSSGYVRCMWMKNSTKLDQIWIAGFLGDGQSPRTQKSRLYYTIFRTLQNRLCWVVLEEKHKTGTSSPWWVHFKQAKEWHRTWFIRLVNVSSHLGGSTSPSVQRNDFIWTCNMAVVCMMWVTFLAKAGIFPITIVSKSVVGPTQLHIQEVQHFFSQQ